MQLLQDAKIKPPCLDIPLSVSQSTALGRHEELVAAGATPLYQDIPGDATNSCAFLSVLIAELFAVKGSDVNSSFEGTQWNALSGEIDNIILAQPNRFNPVRDIKRLYDVSEAYAILRKAKILSRDLDFREELVTSQGVFSKD